MRRRRGFTIVEMLLALLLASMVLASMIALVRLLFMADSVSAQRVEQQTDLAVTQNLMRRVFVSLACAEPMDPAAVRRMLEQQELESRRQRTDGEKDEETEGEAPAEPTPANRAALAPMAPPDIAPMFDLYFQELDGGAAAPVLECVVLDPPGVLNPNAARVTLADFRTIAQGSTREGMLLSRRIVQSVRGRFFVDATFDEEGAESGFALYWEGIEPFSPPVMLIPGVAALEWTVLPIERASQEWPSTHTAKLASEFPMGIRLQVWLEGGRHIDWMFEPETNVLRQDSKETPEAAPGPGALQGRGAEDEEAEGDS